MIADCLATSTSADGTVIPCAYAADHLGSHLFVQVTDDELRTLAEEAIHWPRAGSRELILARVVLRMLDRASHDHQQPVAHR